MNNNVNSSSIREVTQLFASSTSSSSTRVSPSDVNQILRDGIFERFQPFLKEFLSAETGINIEYAHKIVEELIENHLSFRQYQQCAVALIQKVDIDPNFELSQNGMTLLMKAAEKETDQIVDALLNKNIPFDIEKSDNLGNTALVYCIKSSKQISQQRLNVLERLLEKGANPNAFSNTDVKQQSAPLIVLCSRIRKPQLLAALLQHRAQVDAVDLEGDTALHVAAREGFEDILKILVEYNPSVKVLNRNNQSPLNVSKEAVHPILLKLKEEQEQSKFLESSQQSQSLKSEESQGKINKSSETESKASEKTTNSSSSNNKNQTVILDEKIIENTSKGESTATTAQQTDVGIDNGKNKKQDAAEQKGEKLIIQQELRGKAASANIEQITKIAIHSAEETNAVQGKKQNIQQTNNSNIIQPQQQSQASQQIRSSAQSVGSATSASQVKDTTAPQTIPANPKPTTSKKLTAGSSAFTEQPHLPILAVTKSLNQSAATAATPVIPQNKPKESNNTVTSSNKTSIQSQSYQYMNNIATPITSGNGISSSNIVSPVINPAISAGTSAGISLNSLPSSFPPQALKSPGQVLPIPSAGPQTHISTQQEQTNNNNPPQSSNQSSIWNGFYKVLYENFKSNQIVQRNPNNSTKMVIDISDESKRADLSQSAQAISLVSNLERIQKQNTEQVNFYKSKCEQLAQEIQLKDQKIQELSKFSQQQQQQSSQLKPQQTQQEQQQIAVSSTENQSGLLKDPLLCSSNLLDWEKEPNSRQFVQHQIQYFRCQQMLSKKELLPSLNKEIRQFEQEVSTYNEQMKVKFDSLIEKVGNIITQRYPTIKLHTYGSYATQLCLPWSDIDIVLNCSDLHQETPANQQSFLKKIELLLSEDKDLVMGTFNVTNTQVPVLKVTCSPMYDCKKLDITIMQSNHNGLKCVDLVNNYISQYKLLRPLVLILKQFLYALEMNDTYKGGLSSYSLILMLVYYLQLKTSMESNPESEGDLLIQFLVHYGFDESKTKIVIPSRIDMRNEMEQVVIPPFNYPNYPQGQKLYIVDPHNPHNNVSRSTFNYNKIKTAFVCAYTTIHTYFQCNTCKEQRDSLDLQLTARQPPCLILKRFFYLPGRIMDTGDCWIPQPQSQFPFFPQQAFPF